MCPHRETQFPLQNRVPNCAFQDISTSNCSTVPLPILTSENALDPSKIRCLPSSQAKKVMIDAHFWLIVISIHPSLKTVINSQPSTASTVPHPPIVSPAAAAVAVGGTAAARELYDSEYMEKSESPVISYKRREEERLSIGPIDTVSNHLHSIHLQTSATVTYWSILNVIIIYRSTIEKIHCTVGIRWNIETRN